jgi:hypothetical protein
MITSRIEALILKTEQSMLQIKFDDVSAEKIRTANRLAWAEERNFLYLVLKELQ